MKHVRLWSDLGIIPAIPELVAAERFAREDGGGAVACVAAALAMHVARGRPERDLGFEELVGRGAAWFEGSRSERRRLFACFAAYLRWSAPLDENRPSLTHPGVAP